VLNRLTDRGIASLLKTWRASGAVGQKAFDGGGLFLTLTPAQTASWRIKYRLGKERLYSIGNYPDISLAAARIEREAVRAQVRQGRDPVQVRRLTKAATMASGDATFAAVARDWFAKQKESWSAEHYRKTLQAIERDLFPVLGPLPIAEITPAMVATAAEAIVKRGARETAAKALWSAKGIFELAQARGVCRDNPAIPARAVLPRSVPDVHLPALTDWPSLGALLHTAKTAHLTRSVYMCHRLMAFTAARIGNAVAATWSEFDLDTAVPLWVVPREQMKTRHDRTHDHKFVLGPEIVAELREWKRLVPEGALFPSPVAHRTHISRESVEKAYRVTLDMGTRHTPHGWRASFNTLAMDEGQFDRDVVQIALDHVHDNDVVRAYDRGERLEQRVKLAAWWGAKLTEAERAAGEPKP
jgi:integrase